MPESPKNNATMEDHVVAFCRDFEANCPACGYDLRGAQSERCPECNTEIRLRIDDLAPRPRLSLAILAFLWPVAVGLPTLLINVWIALNTGWQGILTSNFAIFYNLIGLAMSVLGLAGLVAVILGRRHVRRSSRRISAILYVMAYLAFGVFAVIWCWQHVRILWP